MEDKPNNYYNKKFFFDSSGSMYEDLNYTALMEHYKNEAKIAKRNNKIDDILS